MRLMNRSLLFGAALVFALSACAPLAHADTIYYYTGAQFTYFTYGASCANFGNCSLSGWMTLASPLGSNAFSNPTHPTAFSFTTGNVTFNSSNSSLNNSLFTTNGSGQITNWIMAQTMNSDGITLDQSSNWPSYGAFGDIVQIDGVGEASNSTAGDWSFTPVPEPASWLLFGTGALALLSLAWHRRRGAADQPLP